MPLWLKWTLRTVAAIILVVGCLLVGLIGYNAWPHSEKTAMNRLAG